MFESGILQFLSPHGVTGVYHQTQQEFEVFSLSLSLLKNICIFKVLNYTCCGL